MLLLLHVGSGAGRGVSLSGFVAGGNHVPDPPERAATVTVQNMHYGKLLSRRAASCFSTIKRCR